MGLNKSSGTLPPVILTLAAISAMEAFLCSASDLLLPLRVTPPLSFDNRLYLHSLQGLLTVGLLDNFLKLLKAFSGRGEQFHENVDCTMTDD
jgi:hypothetical protein